MSEILLAKAICVGLALYVCTLLAVAAIQRRLVYFPDRAPAARYLALCCPGEAVTVTVSDGLALECWWLPPSAPDAPLILYLQGNAGHIGHRAARVQEFARLGWGALLMGYRGFSGNRGTPAEAALIGDAIACLHHLHTAMPDRQIGVWGESLGSGIAVQLAAQAESRISLLVLEAPFTSLADVARHHFAWLRPALPLLKDRYRTAEAIAGVRAPLFVLAGEYDRVVPPEMSRRVFALANEPKALFCLPADHNALGTSEAFHAVARFLHEQR